MWRLKGAEAPPPWTERRCVAFSADNLQHELVRWVLIVGNKRVKHGFVRLINLIICESIVTYTLAPVNVINVGAHWQWMNGLSSFNLRLHSFTYQECTLKHNEYIEVKFLKFLPEKLKQKINDTFISRVRKKKIWYKKRRLMLRLFPP